jgi:hypothetical protein
MATPKTDIEQSVGRILREKHSSPVVVDIIDSHDLFQNQWRKRKTFYKKENYKIIYTSSTSYTPDTSQWMTVFDPSLKDCSKSGAKKKLAPSTKNDLSDTVIVEDDETPKDKYLTGVCLLKFKK